MLRLNLFFWAIVGLLQGMSAQKTLFVAEVFGDQMVLQRDLKIPVWGKALPDEEIVVRLGKYIQKTTSEKDGTWFLELPPLKAGGPFVLEIKSNRQRIELKDVMIGEVWLASGQSNMRFELKHTERASEEISQANYPEIRLFDMRATAYPSNIVFNPEQLAKLEHKEYFEHEGWKICSPKSTAAFSAVAYYFAKELYDSLQVPIGIVHNAIGGSPTQAWIPEKALAKHPTLLPLLHKEAGKSWMTTENIHPWLVERASVNLQTWIDQEKYEWLNNHPFAPAYLYKTGIAPLIPFSIKGVIWYQGESNATHPESHRTLFPLLISSWREAWGQGEFPFYYVQLPGISTRNRWPEFRETQRESLSIPGTGMAIILDAGHPTDVHPKNKKIPGHRLALLALGKTYGYKINCSGPLLNSWRIEGNSIRLIFDYAEGLQIKGSTQIKGLRIQGYTKGELEVLREIKEVFIQKNELLFELPEDISVTKIKYAWAPNPMSNLVDKDGLPASPFKIELEGNN